MNCIYSPPSIQGRSREGFFQPSASPFLGHRVCSNIKAIYYCWLQPFSRRHTISQEIVAFVLHNP